MPTSSSIHSFPSSLISKPLKPLKPSFLTTFFPKTLTLTCTTSQPSKRPTSKNSRKSSYGTSRRSSLKKTFNQEQVVFTAPVSDDPVVAIIGGGMAGLVCALNLEKRGVRSTVFDTVGKCANRLLASSGLPLIARQMKRLELSSIWALLAAFEDPLPIPGGAASSPFEGAFVKGVDSVSWMANNTRKLLHSQNSGPHCWTFLSTAAYGKRNKVPQENIPNAAAEKVKAGMLGGVEAALGLPKESLQKPFYTRVQLCFTEVHEEERVSSEKLQKLGWSFRPLKESLIDSVENYCKAGLID